MDPRRFVAENRPSWERLEALLERSRRRGLRTLEPEELRELGLLHRKVSADLSAARSLLTGSRIPVYLNDLALRSHNRVYRARRRNPLRVALHLARSIPPLLRSRAGALAASTLLFLSGTLLGALGTALDEGLAVSVLGPDFVRGLREGEYWIENVFSVMPHSVASAAILTNNLSVAIFAFALGVSGLLTGWLLFQNGVLLGAVTTLCLRYGVGARFAAFVTGHGVIEISAILIAGAAGFLVFDGWLHPGDATRLEGLRRGAREGLLVLAAALAALLVAGPVEGFISPQETLPAALRMGLGLALGLALWSWVFLGGRRPPNPAAARAFPRA